MTTPVSIPERLFEQLKSAIFDGDIPVGSKLSEPELARDYQVSRGALREAIGRLEACRLVTRKTNVGARVVELSVENLLEIFQVRESLEGMAARLAAQFITADIESSENQAYFQKEGDLDFHYSIVQASHNTTLFNLLCNDLYQLVRLYRYQFGMRSQRAKQAFSEHRHIVAAIKRGDGEMAEHIMRAHIRASRESVERIFIHESNDPLAAEVNA
ncbi:MAG: GntR family transcriptional regulator [Gammaproteobacteria bacterium]